MNKVFKISLLTLLSVGVLSIICEDSSARRRSNSRGNRATPVLSQVSEPSDVQQDLTSSDENRAATTARLEAAASLVRSLNGSPATSPYYASANPTSAVGSINSAADSYKKSSELRDLTSCMSYSCEKDGHFYGDCFNTSNALNLIDVNCQNILEQSANSARLTFDFLSKMNDEFENACRDVSNDTSFAVAPSGDYSQKVYLYKKLSIDNGNETVVSHNEEMTQSQCSEMATGSYSGNQSCPRSFCTDSQGVKSTCASTTSGFKYELLSDYVSTSARCPIEIGFGPLQTNGSYKTISVNVGSPIICTRESFGVSEKDMTYKVKLKDDPAAYAAVIDGSIRVALEGTFGVLNAVKAKKAERSVDAFVSGGACTVEGRISTAESCSLNDGRWDGSACYKINNKGDAKKAKIRNGQLAENDCPKGKWIAESLDTQKKILRQELVGAKAKALETKAEASSAFRIKNLTGIALNNISSPTASTSIPTKNPGETREVYKARVEEHLQSQVDAQMTVVDVYSDIDKDFNKAAAKYSSAESKVKSIATRGKALDQQLDRMEDQVDLYKESANQNLKNAIAGASQIVDGVMSNKGNKYLVSGKCFIMVNGQPSMIISEEGRGRAKIEYNQR